MEHMFTVGVLLVSVLGMNYCGTGQEDERRTTGKQEMGGKTMKQMVQVVKTDYEWREILSPEQYRVTREAGTELAFSGKYHNFKGDGIYECVCCGLPLFSSDQKYHSGTGWPSFWEVAGDGTVIERDDSGWGMRRVEVLCARCNAHLGHVFTDGPQPTGLRYCINSAALNFVPDGE